MPWQADLLCSPKPVTIDPREISRTSRNQHIQCAGHWEHPNGILAYRHTARIYYVEEDTKMVSDDWGFLIPSVVDSPEDFEAGKLVCSTCGCFVHRDKRESHREKCEHA